jgi:hypothetical protein
MITTTSLTKGSLPSNGTVDKSFVTKNRDFHYFNVVILGGYA